jgi:hypothetical protein
MIRLAVAVLWLSLVAAVPPVIAEESETVQARVAWTAGELRLDAVRALDPETSSIVRAKSDAQAALESRISPQLAAALADVPLDSSRTVGGLAAENTEFLESLHSLARSARPEAVFLSIDLARLTVRWVFPLFGPRGVTGYLLPEREAAMRRPLGYAASRAFTGLVIHARGSLPVVGTGTTATLRPALFPRIWDENMDLVLEKGQVRASSLSAWGMVGYLDRLDEEAIRGRAGTDPLRVAARAVFGKLPVDVVIPVEAARQLLSVPQNVEALRLGRICIVYDRLE